jgi:hypothetical protein
MSDGTGCRPVVEESPPDGRSCTLSDSCCHVIVTCQAVLTEHFTCSLSSLSRASDGSGCARVCVLINTSQFCAYY